MARTPHAIAMDIRADYADKGKPVYFAAKPYVDHMAQCYSWDDVLTPGGESAREMILYLVGNLSYWRGEKAKAIKAELRVILGLK